MIKVIKISSEWCKPCKILSPIFDEIKQELQSDNLEFECVSEDDKRFSELSSKFGVRSIPTILIVDEYDITLYARITGLQTKSVIKDKIIEIINEQNG
jgi:thioredoxin 1